MIVLNKISYSEFVFVCIYKSVEKGIETDKGNKAPGVLSAAYQMRWHLKLTHPVSQTSDGSHLAAFTASEFPVGFSEMLNLLKDLQEKSPGGTFTCPPAAPSPPVGPAYLPI